jgi:hypothetical protein
MQGHSKGGTLYCRNHTAVATQMPKLTMQDSGQGGDILSRCSGRNKRRAMQGRTARGGHCTAVTIQRQSPPKNAKTDNTAGRYSLLADAVGEINAVMQGHSKGGAILL